MFFFFFGLFFCCYSAFARLSIPIIYHCAPLCCALVLLAFPGLCLSPCHHRRRFLSLLFVISPFHSLSSITSFIFIYWTFSIVSCPFSPFVPRPLVRRNWFILYQIYVYLPAIVVYFRAAVCVFAKPFPNFQRKSKNIAKRCEFIPFVPLVIGRHLFLLSFLSLQSSSESFLISNFWRWKRMF